MPIITPAVVTAFRTSINFLKNDEVQLFRALASAIKGHSTSTFVDETHGGKVCNVSFTSALGVAETCEIADLLIISLLKYGGIRATFWQAKNKRARSGLESQQEMSSSILTGNSISGISWRAGHQFLALGSFILRATY